MVLDSGADRSAPPAGGVNALSASRSAFRGVPARLRRACQEALQLLVSRHHRPANASMPPGEGLLHFGALPGTLLLLLFGRVDLERL